MRSRFNLNIGILFSSVQYLSAAPFDNTIAKTAIKAELCKMHSVDWLSHPQMSYNSQKATLDTRADPHPPALLPPTPSASVTKQAPP